MSKNNNRGHAQALRARERADGLIRFRFTARVLAAGAVAGAVALGFINDHHLAGSGRSDRSKRVGGLPAVA